MRMNRSIRLFGIVCLSMLLGLPCFGEEVPVQAGMYDGILIGYDAETKSVSGYYQSETGNGQFSCIFYFDGKNDQSPIKIESYFPGTPAEKIYGQLLSSAPATLSV